MSRHIIGGAPPTRRAFRLADRYNGWRARSERDVADLSGEVCRSRNGRAKNLAADAEVVSSDFQNEAMPRRSSFRRRQKKGSVAAQLLRVSSSAKVRRSS